MKIPLPEGAIRLGWTHRKTYDAALAGRLGKVDRIAGRLFVDGAVVDRLAAEAKHDAHGAPDQVLALPGGAR